MSTRKALLLSGLGLATFFVLGWTLSRESALALLVDFWMIWVAIGALSGAWRWYRKRAWRIRGRGWVDGVQYDSLDALRHTELSDPLGTARLDRDLVVYGIASKVDGGIRITSVGRGGYALESAKLSEHQLPGVRAVFYHPDLGWLLLSGKRVPE